MHRIAIDAERVRTFLFPEKPLREYSGKELAIATLGLMAIGTLTVSVIAAPGLSHAFTLFRTENQKDRWRIYQRIKRLETAGLIHRHGKWYEPTERGRALIRDALLRTPPAQGRAWNGEWHMVVFDLPSKHTRARFDLVRFLTDLGFVQYQRSIYVHRQDLQTQVEEFCALYDVRAYINFLSVRDTDNALALKALTRHQSART